MLKRMLLLVVTALAVTAVGGHGTALAAVWLEEGQPLADTEPIWLSEGLPLESPQSIGFDGQMKVTGELGAITCDVVASGAAEPKAEGELDEVELGSCATSGLIAHCAAEITAENSPWGLAASDHNGAPTVRFTAVGYTVALSGLFCPTLEFSGTLRGAPDDATEMNSVALSGTLTTGGVPYTASGTLDVVPPDAFGVKIVQLSRAVEFDGTIKLSGELGGWQCDYHMDGSIKSLSNEGEVTTFEPSSCKPFGLIGGCTMLSYTPTDLPWSIYAEEAEGNGFIRVSQPRFTIDLSGFLCPPKINGTGGNVTLTPENDAAILQMTAGGTVETSSGPRGASGSMDLSPGGLYGIG